ncbi:MAG: Cyclic pyranopterin monophosphate synthase [candidate division WS2 bacterium]|uniref:Cyclic pyranopterin monophosphate synthase n=1 Tax=Psychracetigena formicireducens TaxID=2986056 RepID=A0A9E2BG73_PSYF1|nr:Cyclic pyranopterin monophosphate synthase [Candidatus Psychracetigena formicireducens]MBT9145006.1 Cyclic pyranopterin monophosphate synthase [Candidatus Psychracetigena formicireducens]MBT9150248.1 Cyclic pyranopterin monophosphate synthase [Candidatus Psychracetigena formicireducens]
MNNNEFTHLDEKGQVKMVDVSSKSSSLRTARARGVVKFKENLLSRIVQGDIPKGDVLTVAKVAGIQGAKNTHQLIPLTHPLTLSLIDINFKALNEKELEIISEVRCEGKTGVEMEALTAVAVCSLTVYDMCKSLDREIEISDIALIYKDGGKTGIFRKELGTVCSLNTSQKKGEKKTPVEKLVFVEGRGVEGDAHAGPGNKQVSLLSLKSINKMKTMGVEVEPGSFAENVTVAGISVNLLPIDTILHLGEEVKLKVTQLGKVCVNPCFIGKQVGDCLMPREGIFAEVIEGGKVKRGDKIVAVVKSK